MPSVLRILTSVSILAFIALACAPTRFGGMGVHGAFSDARVARLVDAIGRGDYVEADKQLKAGADVNTVGKEGITPLFWVFGTKNIEGTEYLLKAGANPNYRLEGRGESVMSIAAGGNSPRLLELLLKYHGDPNLFRYDTPLLDVAVGQFRKENIDLLLKYGADINISWGQNETPAQTAAALGRFDITAYLLERGASAKLDDLAGTVVYSIVPPKSEAQRWKDKVIEMLKQRGIKIPSYDLGEEQR